MLFTKKGAVEWLVVGLGNIGPKYENTRHNAGFMAVDALADACHAVFKKSRFKGETAECTVNGHRVLLLKPSTLMNLSGEAVQKAAAFYKIPSRRILVLFDDVSLEVGALRIRRKGSDGGHNGIKNILLYIDEDFPRVKLGVGHKPRPDYDLAAWVLSRFKEEEKAPMAQAAAQAVEAVPMILDGRIDEAMNRFNS